MEGTIDTRTLTLSLSLTSLSTSRECINVRIERVRGREKPGFSIGRCVCEGDGPSLARVVRGPRESRPPSLSLSPSQNQRCTYVGEVREEVKRDGILKETNAKERERDERGERGGGVSDGRG